MEFFRRSLREIKESGSLRFLGSLLALSHIFTFYNWQGVGLFSGSASPICWNSFPKCQLYYFLSQSQTETVFKFYLASAVLALIGFISYRMISLGLFFLLPALIIQIFFISYDLSLADNIIVVLIFLNIGFMFVPQKIHFTKSVVFSSYIILGLLKLNQEWMAGYWLTPYLTHILPVKGIEWLAAFSMMIDLVVPLLLFSRVHARFFSGFTLLFIYGLLKLIFIDKFTGAVESLLVLFFVFSFYEQDRKERQSLYQSFIHPEPSKLWAYVSLVVFWSFQIYPHTIAGKNYKTLPWQIRKYPVPIECQSLRVAQFNDKVEVLDNTAPKNTNSLLKCSSLIHFNTGKDLCNTFATQEGFVGLQSFFIRRLISEKDFTRVFEIENICESSVTFSNTGGK